MNNERKKSVFVRYVSWMFASFNNFFIVNTASFTGIFVLLYEVNDFRNGIRDFDRCVLHFLMGLIAGMAYSAIMWSLFKALKR